MGNLHLILPVQVADVMQKSDVGATRASSNRGAKKIEQTSINFAQLDADTYGSLSISLRSEIH